MIENSGGAPARRPNILFMIADDHRGFGDPRVRTPHLDALAERGVRFAGAHCQGGLNGAICAPSRAQIMTGNELFGATRTTVVGDGAGTSEIADDAPILPEALAAAGYRTHLVGKWHNGEASAIRGFRTGERVFFGGMSDHNAVPVRDLDSSRAEPLSAPTVTERFSTDLFAEAAERFLRDLPDPASGGPGGAAGTAAGASDTPADEPFFLYVAFTAPHDPRTPPGPWAARHTPDAVDLPPSFLPEHPFDNGELDVRDEQLTPRPRGAATVRRHLADYYGMVEHLDDGVGRVLRALRESGREADTIVVYTADHGLALGSHGLLGKQNMYQHSLRVPLVMAGPGIAPGGRVDALTLHADLFPTLADLTGTPAPPTVTGRSLVPLLDGRPEPGPGRSYVHAAYTDVQRAVRDERFKLIRYRRTARTGAGTDRTQLFDLAADPWETRDLAPDPAHAPTTARLSRELARWQHATCDPHAADFAPTDRPAT